MTIQQFIDRLGIVCTSEQVDSNPYMESSQLMNHYYVTLRRGLYGEMKLHYSMGLGLSGKPQAADVLYCLQQSARAVDDYDTFEDWAGEFGYDTDSRKAERTYLTEVAQREQLYQFLGSVFYADLLACDEDDD